MGESTWEIARLPGFRFHPTEEELLTFYLQNTILGKKISFDTIGFLNIYLHDPKELPGLAKNGEREWYFFVPRDRRHGNGGRPNRTTETGFWKATGSDRKIMSSNDPKKIIGLKKTLVFYKGRAPRGCKTDWVMNEYRLPDTFRSPKDIVLCKIYRKATSLKELEQRAQIEQEEERKAALLHSLVPPPMDFTTSFYSPHVEEVGFPAPMAAQHVAFKKEYEDVSSEQFTAEEEKSYYEEEGLAGEGHYKGVNKNDSLQLTDLQVPTFNMDWTQDPFWTQLRSPWLENLMTPPPYANDIVLCKIYRKASSLKELEQRAHIEQEEERKAALLHSLVPPPMDITTSFYNPHVDEGGFPAPMAAQHVAFKKEYEDASSDQFTAEEEKNYYEEEGLAGEGHYKGVNKNGSLQLTDLQVPTFNMGWTQDPSWTQLRSPWLENLMTPPYANVLNF